MSLLLLFLAFGSWEFLFRKDNTACRQVRYQDLPGRSPWVCYYYCHVYFTRQGVGQDNEGHFNTMDRIEKKLNES